MTMFKKILIANRGEIARRIIRTCHDMGIAAAAVYSDADRYALHVLEADEAVHIGKSDPLDSYLHIDKILAAAKATGADAIHPGYGFLAENHEFARRCIQEHIVFIGPPPHVIHDLGDKTVARRIMTQTGVPVIPGMMHPEPNPDLMKTHAENLGYPVVVKAAAGGGGKGMRIVSSENDLTEACIQAQREANAAFGNNAVYLEKYLKNPRHIEFQILADSFGNVVHLLERECSIQRRHQKIIEETPCPALTSSLRETMGKAAVDAARASGYVNAGTVEFLLDQEGKFYFLEVNTRLQVEHPVTEMVTGLDLVRLQIEIAAGRRLEICQKDILGRGHAMECRIYGEDPENHFFPSPGKITYIKEPSGPGIRNDCGVYSGFEVPMEYDPIISKLIVHAPDRKQAISRMIHALSGYVILGIKTPIPFLIDVLSSQPFCDGDIHTGFLDAYFSNWRQHADAMDLAAIAYIIDEITRPKQNMTAVLSVGGDLSPWHTLGRWRL